LEAAVIALETLRIRQGDFRLTADWTLASGARLALLGPSGAGKSTLLSAIAGLTPLSAGRIRIDDKDISDLAPGDRPVTLLFQDHNLFPHLDVAANVGLGLRADLRLSGDDRKQVAEVLSRVGLTGMGARHPASLSGGERQRVALARALLRNRPVLLLDEPFAALGPGLRRDMHALVASLLDETGATLILVTHDPADALALCPLTSVVADGQAAAPAPTADLLANPPRALADYLG
jgi:thiamine transport system ATP-binding protein